MRPWQDKRQEIDLERINYGDTMKKVSIYFSILLLFLLVELSSVHAGWNEAKTAYEHGDYETEFQEYEALAEQGDVLARYNLGVMYDIGKGVPKDFAESLNWYKMAAKQREYARAQFYVGWFYYNGWSVPENYAEAFKWFKKAAEQGYALAQRILGEMYLEGEGVPRDYTMSYMWLNLAADQGNEGAITYRSLLENEMTTEQIAEAQKLSREFKVKKPLKP